MSDWQPLASIEILKNRALLLAQLRQFFAARQVWEVDVPAITAAAVTDPNIDSLCISFAEQSRWTGYLVTSPEFYMKRLLAAGSGDIYSLSHAFRADESGARHHREFMLLEWYRVDWVLQALMQEVQDLVQNIFTVLGGVQPCSVKQITYRQAFIDSTGLDPFCATVVELQQYAQQHLSPAFSSDERDIWLDLLFSHCVEPQLQGWVFVTQFPASQAALAQTASDTYGNPVAARFELYIDGVEIANGYQEENNVEKLRARFQLDQQLRAQRQQPVPAIDERFMAAMSAGLPSCAGVALGVDRLLMAVCNQQRLDNVIAFRE